MNARDNDIRVLANAVLEHSLEHGDYDISCYFCHSSNDNDQKKITHDLDCPVLIARDLLTK